jgi:hypothetical protein
VKLSGLGWRAARWAAVVATSVGAAGAACSAPGAVQSSAVEPSSGLGRVGLTLSLPDGLALTSLNWAVTNSATSFSENGSVGLGDAQSIEFVVGNLPKGSGYAIQVSATDSEGDPCSGTGTFAITAGGTSDLVLTVTCTLPPDAALPADVSAGSVAVEASVVLVPSAAGPQCPGIMSLSISPGQERIGSSSALSLDVLGPAPAVSWTQSGAGAGTFGDASAASTTFACTAPGSVSLEATVSLPGSGSCAGVAYTTAVGTLLCEVQCNTVSDCPASSTVCATPACNANTCGVSDAPIGTACSDSGGSICNGGGSCVVPTFNVVRVGDGFSALAATTSPVFIDTYGLDGGLVGSPVAMPTTASGSNQPLTLVGTETTEGDLTTSADGRFLVMLGHGDPPGTSVTTSGNCVAAFVASGGAVNGSTSLPSAFVTAGIVRSAVSLDGNELWAAGTASDSTGGIWYSGSPANAQLIAGSSNVTARDLRIAGGQLYADSNANPPGLAAVGTGTPTSGSPTLTTLAGLPTSSSASPYGFVFFDLNPSIPGVDTLYIADDRNSAGGGVGKWVLSPTDAGTYSWTSAWAEGVAGSAGDAGTGNGLRGLAGYATGGTVTLMGTTGMAKGAQDSLVVIVDTGVGIPTPSVVGTALTNETFRGVALPPHD